MPRKEYLFAEARRNLLWGFAYLTLATWVLGIALPKYVPISFQRAIPAFSNQDHWTFAGASHSFSFAEDKLSVSLDSHERSVASFEFDRPKLNVEIESGIRFSGDIDYDILEHPNRRNLGGIISFDELNEPTEYRKQLFSIRCESGWSGKNRWSKVVFPSNEAQRLRMNVGLIRNAGRISVSNASVQIVKHWPPFPWFFGSLILLWIFFGVRVAYHFLQTGNGILLVLPAVLTLIIGIGITLPNEAVRSLLAPLNALMTKNGLVNPIWIPIAFSAGKLGHVIGFAAFAFVALLMRRRFSLSRVQMATIFFLLATATEGMQLFLPDRSTRFSDLLFDGAGVLIGVVAYAVLALIRRSFSALFKRLIQPPKPEAQEQSESDIAASKTS